MPLDGGGGRCAYEDTISGEVTRYLEDGKQGKGLRRQAPRGAAASEHVGECGETALDCYLELIAMRIMVTAVACKV